MLDIESQYTHLFKEILKKIASNEPLELETSSDLYMLGLHLHQEHGITDKGAFDRLIKFGILEVVSPKHGSSKGYRKERIQMDAQAQHVPTAWSEYRVSLWHFIHREKLGYSTSYP